DALADTADDNWLTVNVFTPDLGGNLPVMVWIQGGGYMFGTSGQGTSDPKPSETPTPCIGAPDTSTGGRTPAGDSSTTKTSGTTPTTSSPTGSKR
ncbi:carboxylesterase family protein, partial [Kibdelosporangium lantanae]